MSISFCRDKIWSLSISPITVPVSMFAASIVTFLERINFVRLVFYLLVHNCLFLVNAFLLVTSRFITLKLIAILCSELKLFKWAPLSFTFLAWKSRLTALKSYAFFDQNILAFEINTTNNLCLILSEKLVILLTLKAINYLLLHFLNLIIFCSPSWLSHQQLRTHLFWLLNPF